MKQQFFKLLSLASRPLKKPRRVKPGRGDCSEKKTRQGKPAHGCCGG